jgi:Trk-type K+ transport system membrane component
MDDHLEEKLDKLTKTVEEDHKMIRSLYVRARLASILRIIYLLIIIGTAVGAYYFLDPYLKKIMDLYDGIKGAQSTFASSSVLQFFGSFGNN